MKPTTTMIAPYITIFSFALSFFQNSEIVGGMDFLPRSWRAHDSTCWRERSVRDAAPKGVQRKFR